MPPALAASILDALAGLQVVPAGQEAGNRFLLEGLAWGGGQDGGFELRIARMEAASLRVSLGALELELGRMALHQVTGQVRIDGGAARLGALHADSAELSEVRVRGPLAIARQPAGALHPSPAAHHAPPAQAAAGHWELGPLAAANGSLRARILDAHLLFDADVTVPIRQGTIDFNQASVAHVGPDSRMGVSRLGIYVDAPNGRSYLYQFTTSPVAGVEFERRGAGLGLWVSQRGSLQLQPFAEGVLRGAQGPAVTEQTRVLLDRTALSGDVRLGDGPIAAPGLRAELVGRGEGRNAVRLHSEAVGRGVSAQLDALSLRNATAGAGPMRLLCDAITGALTLWLADEDGQLRFEARLPDCKLDGLHLQPAT